MANYPIMVNLENKDCVVVGGGRVATRKIANLLEAKAKVVVVSISSSVEIKEWAKANLLHWKKKEFEKDDVKKAFLVIAATDSLETNRQVYDSVSANQLINVVDVPNLCNFTVPTVLRRGKLAIAVSTTGGSPLLAKKIKQDLSEIYDDSYEQYLEFLDVTRKDIIAKISDYRVKSILLQHLLDPIYLHLTREGEYAERNICFENFLRKEGYSL